MKILIQFPTLARPDKFVRALSEYVRKSGDNNSIYFNINCDHSDSSMKDENVCTQINDLLKEKSNVCGKINYDWDTDKISAINDHIEDYGDFDVLVCASDDMIPQVDCWDEEITSAMEENFPDLNGCVHFDDGNTNGSLITFSILGRELYNHFGYIYHPDYKSLYCDDEFTQVIRSMDKEKYIDKVIITHEHYSVEGTENHGDVDLAARKTLHFSGRDQLVFEERKKLGFPKERITRD